MKHGRPFVFRPILPRTYQRRTQIEHGPSADRRDPRGEGWLTSLQG
jgi:hypothetical protein